MSGRCRPCLGNLGGVNGCGATSGNRGTSSTPDIASKFVRIAKQLSTSRRVPGSNSVEDPHRGGGGDRRPEPEAGAAQHLVEAGSINPGRVQTKLSSTLNSNFGAGLVQHVGQFCTRIDQTGDDCDQRGSPLETKVSDRFGAWAVSGNRTKMAAGGPNHGEVGLLAWSWTVSCPRGPRGKTRRDEFRIVLLPGLPNPNIHGFSTSQNPQKSRNGGDYGRLRPEFGRIRPTLPRFRPSWPGLGGMSADLGLERIKPDRERPPLLTLGPSTRNRTSPELAPRMYPLLALRGAQWASWLRLPHAGQVAAAAP